MATIRVEKTKDFSIVSNTVLRDKRLSLRARGLLVFMLSLSETWEYSIKGLAYATGESEGKVGMCLKELEKHGYLTRERTRNAKGQMEGTNYTLWESPQVNDTEKPSLEKPSVENPSLDNPVLEKPSLEKPSVENLGQRNTNKNNNKYIYNNKPKEELKGSGGSSVVPAREQTDDGDEVNRFKSGAVAEALMFWQDNFGPLSPLLADKLIDLVRTTGLIAFKKACEKAVERNKRNFAYIRKVAIGIAEGDEWEDKPPEKRKRGGGKKNDVARAAEAAQRILDSGEVIDL